MDEPKHHKRSKEKKEKKRKKKEKKSRVKKKEKKQKDKELKKLAKAQLAKAETDKGQAQEESDFSVPIDLMYSKARVPETPEEYQKRQSQIRRVTDPETGRTRLIKGDGEVIEEIVSRERHKAINKQATEGDGRHFQTKTVGLK